MDMDVFVVLLNNIIRQTLSFSGSTSFVVQMSFVAVFRKCINPACRSFNSPQNPKYFSAFFCF